MLHSADARPFHDLNGVPAIRTAVASNDNTVVVDPITPEQLSAAGFGEPDLWDGPHTGIAVALCLSSGEAATNVIVGQYFDLDGSRSDASTRVLVTSDPPVPQAEPYVPLSVLEAAVAAAGSRSQRSARDRARAPASVAPS